MIYKAAQMELAIQLKENASVSDLSVTLATEKWQIEQAQRLRYRIFFEEMGGIPSPEVAEQKRDFDEFDEFCDHLIVLDNSAEEPVVVGTYRILRDSVAKKAGRFYSGGEFDISKIISGNYNVMEVGRSCVDTDLRNKPIIQLLWRGIAIYIKYYKIDILFGCASFSGLDVEPIKEQLSYLYHNHLAPEEIRAKAWDNLYINMNWHKREELDNRRILADLPPLIKGYLRLGGFIGDGAVPDPVCSTIDVFTLVKTDLITGKYRHFFFR